MNVTIPRDALPQGFELHWYRVNGVLGQGGFGITYLAHDTNLDQSVAIKEYLPVEYAMRVNEYTVAPRADSQSNRYQWGLERFISEARTLARFDHPNIVRVHSVFEFNGTAYMVMRYEKGESLDTVLERQKTLDERALLDILFPILDGLAAVHQAGFIHRDIKPANIYLREDGSPVLLDFGSARQTDGRAKTLTILIAPGYAPFEQYYSSGETQGPWTDIYSLGATLYRALASVAPIDAIERSKGILGSTRDVLVPASLIGKERYSEPFLNAIDHALSFSETDQPQSIGQWLEEFHGKGCGATGLDSAAPVEAPNALPARRHTSPTPAQPSSPGGEAIDQPLSSAPPPASSGRSVWLLFALAGLVAGVVLADFLRDPVGTESLADGAGALTDEQQQLRSTVLETANKTSELEKVSTQLNQVESRLQLASAELAERELVLTTVSERLSALDTDLEERAEQLTSLQTAIETKTRELNTIVQNTDTLLGQHEVSNTEFVTLTRQVKELGDQHRALEQSVEENNNTVARLREEISSEKHTKNQLSDEITTLNDEAQQSLARWRGFEDKIATLKAETTQLETVRDTQRNDIAGLKAGRIKLERDILALTVQHTQAEERITVLQSAHSKAGASASESVLSVEMVTSVAESAELRRARGLLASQDYQGAMSLLKPLASQCHGEAQTVLGEVYEAISEPFIAYLWYRAAALSSGADMTAELARAARTLQPAEIEQAATAAENTVRKCEG